MGKFSEHRHDPVEEETQQGNRDGDGEVDGIGIRRRHPQLRFLRQAEESKLAGFKFVGEPVKEFAQGLRRQRGKDIWMMGGGEDVVVSDEGEIDEFQINVVPILIGEGIPLIQPRRRLIRL